MKNATFNPAATEAAIDKAAAALADALHAFEHAAGTFTDIHSDAPTTAIKSQAAADRVAKAANKVTSAQRRLELAYDAYNAEARS